MFSLHCEENTRKGDSGPMSMLISCDSGERVDGEVRPKVGCVIRVGSIYGRTYQHQDWWQTSEIVEILEDTPNKVRFRTWSGSTYIWEIL